MHSRDTEPGDAGGIQCETSCIIRQRCTSNDDDDSISSPAVVMLAHSVLLLLSSSLDPWITGAQ